MQGEPIGSEGGPATGKAGLLQRLHGEWLEILATILLALATVATTWCAYQASRWSSREAVLFNEANAARVHAAEADDLADTQLDIDVEVFLVYVMALRKGDAAEAEYIEAGLFRDEMKDAVEAWIAADPMNDPAVPSTPFEMPQYVNASREEADRLEAEASAKVEEAKEAIEISDFYVLLTVLFASVLFFAGICTKFKNPAIRITVLVIGATFFIASLVVTVMKPVL
ncbi:MAG: hypothetical protein PHS26_12290 [Actinomycetota bacterium]|nr:hypothetical protein [Actinomycetota bacterium]